jgi:sporulation protein YlmC with PRC-barrel domain
MGDMMKRLTLALTVCAGLTGASLFAADAEVKVKTDKQHYRTELKSGQTCTAKHLLGARVNDAQGKKIGEIEDLVIDPASGGRVQFAVVRLNSDLAQGNKVFTPIPIAAFRPETATTATTDTPRTYVLTVDRSKLMSASRFNVERWPADQTTYTMWGPDVYSHYGMTYDATGAPGSEVYIQRGDADRGLEYKDTVEPPTDFREKSVDNGTAPDGKGTFPFLHEATDQD